MLVIRRRQGESILVNGDIAIEVMEISGTRVKLGIRAPHHVPVARGETLAIARENKMASGLVAGNGPGSLDDVVRLLQLTPDVTAPCPAQDSAGLTDM